MMVRPVAPVKAVKMAQVTSVMIESPPGSHPNRALENLKRRLGVPLSERRYPEKVKRGMATKIGVVAIRYISMIMAEESIWLVNNRTRATPAMTTKRGAPRNMMKKAPNRARSVIVMPH
jgi:hypothetical protein